MSRLATATIHLEALRNNLQRARAHCSGRSQVVAVIKADGYGHGLLTVAHALHQAELFAVGCLDEAVTLRNGAIGKPILLLEGFEGGEELQAISQLGLQTVIHSRRQWSLFRSVELKRAVTVWLKIDSGMHRLGVDPEEAELLLEEIQGHPAVEKVVLLSHFANADDVGSEMNHRQQQVFEQCGAQSGLSRSMANSAALLSRDPSHYQFVRPGIMLYGGSPFSERSAASLGLAPAMTLQAPLIAIKTLKRGEHVGYGSLWSAPEEMRIGVVAIGYGHGYPRQLPSGTPLLIRGRRVPLVGRVSMDMVTVDLRELPEAEVGDSAILWGEGLPADEIAALANTICYELFCQLTSRVQRVEG